MTRLLMGSALQPGKALRQMVPRLEGCMGRGSPEGIQAGRRQAPSMVPWRDREGTIIQVVLEPRQRIRGNQHRLPQRVVP